MSKVFITDLRAKSPKDNRQNKIKRLFDACIGAGWLKEGSIAAIKLHFGEPGGDAFIQPIFVRPIVEKLKENGVQSFLTDTNTLYAGQRANGRDHLMSAYQNGFTAEVTGAPVIIADGLRSDYYYTIPVNLKHFETVKIAGDIEKADAMVVMSHFKGHEMAGFGGAIKNLAMGCAPAAGKRDQHSTRPFVKPKKCVACGRCFEVCPVDALSYVDGKAKIHKDICIGCGDCLANCAFEAIALDWTTELTDFTEKMVEYAYGAVASKKDKVLYINFLTRISPDCDCCGWSDSPIVSDIGILASFDPVAIDQACFDLVNAQKPLEGSRLADIVKKNGESKDHFKALHPNSVGELQLSYGEAVGLGSTKYELVKID